MIMAVPSATLPLEFDSSANYVGREWSKPAGNEWSDLQARGVPEIVLSPDDHREALVESGADEVLLQLFHMTLSSLRGYQELADLTTRPELRSLLEVIARQRSAQCRSLARMSDGLIPEWINLEKSDDAALADPSAADLQIVWLRTIWNFEQEEFPRFGENLDQAELLLEDAFLNASETFLDSEFSVIFRQHAINICGARQCLEDVVGDHVSTDRY
ncbi:MAG: hypothetical protein JWN70_4639 [Planctomycetaceae bacterium]|nr:hypothetical protein [Planctomycetaceae bacterium]